MPRQAPFTRQTSSSRRGAGRTPRKYCTRRTDSTYNDGVVVDCFGVMSRRSAPTAGLSLLGLRVAYRRPPCPPPLSLSCSGNYASVIARLVHTVTAAADYLGRAERGRVGVRARLREGFADGEELCWVDVVPVRRPGLRELRRQA